MARLFLSLYLFIAVALIGLSSALEHVFFNDDTLSSAESDAILSVLENLTQSGINLQSFATKSGLDTQVLSLTSMAWSPEETQRLTQGEVINLFDDELGQQFYVLDASNQLLEITLSGHTSQRSPYLLYSALFYLLLGGLLALWVWPLWRDLALLKKNVSYLNLDGTIDPIRVGRRSLIKPIADAINNLSTQVSQLMLTQRELTGAVAHEFRTPLSRLKFALAIKPDPGSSPWQAMNEDVDELEKLVQEMLSFTSMEVHKPELNMSEIPLRDLCEQIATKHAVDHQRIQVTVSGENVIVLADEHYMQRAIENLLLNAYRYAKSQIELRVLITSHHVRICVDDDGKGIAIELTEKIFEPFFRPDEGRNRKRGGAGLGLAIVKRIMQWHNGDCWAEHSALGGARFVLQMNSIELATQ